MSAASQGWASIETPGYGKGYVAADHLVARPSHRPRLSAPRARHAGGAARAQRDRDHQRSARQRPTRPISSACTSALAASCRIGVDAIGFLAPDLHVKKTTPASARSAPAPTAARSAGCIGKARPAFVAKNRYGLPAKMPVTNDFSYDGARRRISRRCRRSRRQPT